LNREIIDAACLKTRSARQDTLALAGPKSSTCHHVVETDGRHLAHLAACVIGTKQTPGWRKPPDRFSLRKDDRFGLDLAPVNLHRQTWTGRDMDHAIDYIQRVDEEVLVHRIPLHQVLLIRRVNG
jgi:hypothetical protein